MNNKQIQISCFKSYDVRGEVPSQLNETIAYRIGRAYVDFLNAKSVVVGHDIRLTSPSLCDALVKGITEAGADVIHIGQCGTEEVYFATFHLRADGGICVTASHNPIEYNGMKFVKRDARPISQHSGLETIRKLAETAEFKQPLHPGNIVHRDIRADYVSHLLQYIDLEKLKPLTILCNAGNGGAGAIIDALDEHLPFTFIKINHSPDGNFPNGIPNPLLPERRKDTIEALKKNRADFAIAWDGDFDRCFFFDENGRYVDAYYMVGLLAKAFLKKDPCEKIVYDPRLTWNTEEEVTSAGGVPIISKTGHALIKAKMREVDAVYGGEMSAHHYFRDFAYCDNGTIPWLIVAELLCNEGKSLASMIANREARYPCSGEINLEIAKSGSLIDDIEQHYRNIAKSIEKLDGLSMQFDQWRFNLRESSTEPALRLNVESRGDISLMETKTQEVLALIKSLDAIATG